MRHLSLHALIAPFIFALACSPSTPPADAPSSPAPDAAGTVPAATSGEPTPSKAGPAGAACGGLAGFGCATGLYCAFALDAHCGAADQTGLCKPLPEMCTEQYSPVCGCNDKTYPNECAAAREGIAVGSTGQCAASATAGPSAAPAPLAEGATCGTRGVPGDCADGLYCKYKTECGATDSGGTCVKRPQMCTKIYRPVCGCDGKTYASDCVAASQGASVKHEAECKK